MKSQNCLFACVASFCLIIFSSVFAYAQNDREKGIELYNKGDFAGAVPILQRAVKQNADDGEAWFSLGLSLVRTQNADDGDKALKQAAKLLPQDARPFLGLAYAGLSSGKLSQAKDNAEKALALNPKETQAYYFLSLAQRRRGHFKSAVEAADKAISINPALPDFYWLKAQTIFAEAIYDGEVGNKTKVFGDILNALESYPNLSAETQQSKFIKEKIENAKLFLEAVRDVSKLTPPGAPPPANPGVTPLKILSKPRPSYTDAARQNQEKGVITLAILFSSNGTIEYVLPLKGLNFGLTAEAIKAAYKIKFEPQIKNGQPVSVIRTVEYSFSIY